MSLDIRLLMGRQWLKMTSSFGNTITNDFISKYKIASVTADSKNDVPVTAHKESWQQVNLVANRLMDGLLCTPILKMANMHTMVSHR